MRFNLEGLDVYFPYENLYPEQYAYMLEMKRALDARGHGALEMPTGTGKTITVLSLCVSYQLAHPEVGKLIYCTRTVPEMEKVLAECRTLQKYIGERVGEEKAQMLAVGLSSRKNMCVHPKVAEEGIERECGWEVSSVDGELGARAEVGTAGERGDVCGVGWG
jgi:DNA excision repair protein ERCC-2